MIRHRISNKEFFKDSFSKLIHSLSIENKFCLMLNNCNNSQATSSKNAGTKSRKHVLSAGSWMLLLALPLIFSACSSSKEAKKEGPKSYIIYPTPPDPVKIQYLTKISNTLDLGKKQTAFSKLVLGEEKAKTLVKPYGIAIHKGKIYVCDQYGGGMEVIDLEKRDLQFFKPTGKGQLKVPINCTVDERGYLYIADAGRMEVVVFDDKGNFVTSIGEKEKFKPTDVCIYDNKIYVANPAGNKINVYSKDSTNKLLFSFPQVEPSDRSFLGMPLNIAAAGGRVYAADFGYSMIKMFNADGSYIDSIGSRGDRIGQFSKLKGIAIDRDTNVYAVDAAYDNVQVFNKEGKLLLVFSGHYKGPGDLMIPAKIMIDYDNLNYFQKYVDPAYDLKYLIFITSQYGPDLINVYGRVEPKGGSGK